MADTPARPPSTRTTSSSVAEQAPGGTGEPLYQVKLLSALRSGDPAAIHPFLAEIGKDKRKSVDGDIDTGAAALHLAVRCGSAQTVALLLSHRAISPNGVHPPGSGTTPLHLAAALGRLDVVNLLLEQDGVDDALRDAKGRTCRDVARGRDVVRAIDDSRALLNATYRSLLHSYILSPPPSPPPQGLLTLLASPRAKSLDLSSLDAETGTTLLHEAARRRDLRLIELAVRAGADVFVRDRRGKLAGQGGEGGGGDERVRVFLRQFANHDKTLIPNPNPAPLTEPPVLKGYLNKYTNVAKGYNTRWFVLQNGVLSYYRHQDDETIASRGSISMKNAVLHVAEKTKLEVHSSPSPARGAHAHASGAGSSGAQKWYMKANHPVEAHRWAEAIRNSIEWFRIKEREREVGVGVGGNESDASSMEKSQRSQRRRSGESDSSALQTQSSLPIPPSLVAQTPSRASASSMSRSGFSGTSSTGTSTGTPGRPSATIWRKTLSRGKRGFSRERDGDRDKERGREREALVGSAYAFVDSGDASASASASPSLGVNRRSLSRTRRRRGSYGYAESEKGDADLGLDGDDLGDEEEEEEDSNSNSSSYNNAGSNNANGKITPPHPDFELQGNAASAQLELSIGLLASVIARSGESLSSLPLESQDRQAPIQSQASSPGQLQSSSQSQSIAQSQSHSQSQSPSQSQFPAQPPTLTHPPTPETLSALRESLQTTQSLLNTYLTMTHEREIFWRRSLRKERRRQRFWEESLAVVVKEGEDLERELRKRSRRRGSRVFGPSVSVSVGGGRGHSPAQAGMGYSGLQPSPVVEVHEPVTPSPLSSNVVVESPKELPRLPKRSGTADTLVVDPAYSGYAQDTIKQRPTTTTTTTGLQTQSQAPLPAAQPGTLKPLPPVIMPSKAPEPDEEPDTDEEDEFFDAIEANNLPNLVVYEGLKSPASLSGTTLSPSFVPLTSPKSEVDEEDLEREVVEHPAGLLSLTLAASLSNSSTPSSLPLSLALPLRSGISTYRLPLPPGISVPPYAGYVNLRTRLGINSDQRPSTSLWSVLKHSIGKDLTKISFPVFFNEPTSMLQRMAEDMEFSECLDVASHEKDPLRRIAFVAAFAMSNYSSTIGRIAKPFNPMLSETFEYVRLDKQYRYVSEQVSHHPPISACWAESTSWHYYGEVDAQNKFMGKSFEIRPTGIAHADLLLPEEMAPHYPKAKGEAAKGKVVEHYSWKKVTTNVSGFILGSPTIDHYGDMVVTNHRTGDQCILTFKPRGWRGKDAYEISGEVIDAQGNVAYEIAGRWNSQLVAKKVGMGNGLLHPDISVTGLNSPSVAPEYILLWRNSEKPPGSPFNLTPFAITLNDCPQDTLRPFLCPTDCRLRPDQRAFELGKYELANDLKTAQEEKQRSIRKAREEGKIPPHRPRWFVAETDGDTGERVWSPMRTDDWRLEYWIERERVWKEGGWKPWTGVDDIFIEEPKVVSELMKR